MSRTNRSDSGTILLQAVVMIMIVSSLATSMVVLSNNERIVSTRSLSRVGALTAADGATQMAVEKLIATTANDCAFAIDFDGNVSIGSVSSGSTVLGSYRSPRQTVVPMSDPAAGGADPLVPWTTVRYHVRKIGTPILLTAPDGFKESTQQYHVWSTVYTRTTSTTVDPRQGETAVSVHRVVNVGLASVFQYAIFYANDIELVRTATMTVSGRVHANGDIYLDPSNPLLFKPTPGGKSFLHTAGKIERTHPNYPLVGGSLKVEINGSNVSWPQSLESTAASWATDVGSLFTDTGQTSPAVMDGQLGASTITPPTFQSFAPGGYYDQNAGLNIKYDGTTFTATLGGSDVTSLMQASGALSTTTFWDQRAKNMVSVVDVDVSKLGSNFPGNGVIYASRSDSSPASPNAVRLRNGKTIPNKMTFVSPNPVYVQGDFNSNASGNPLFSSAIMADAVTLQSNAWNDSDSLNRGQRITPSANDNPQNKSGTYTISGQMPTATQTTYNFAMVAGNTLSDYAKGATTLGNPNQSGFMNGGVANLPRFLEDWSGVSMNYQGSMVNLFQSQVANHPFAANAYVYNETTSTNPPKPVNGNVYNPPTRNWSYDTGLMASAPPMTPQVARIVENVYWTN